MRKLIIFVGFAVCFLLLSLPNRPAEGQAPGATRPALDAALALQAQLTATPEPGDASAAANWSLPGNLSRSGGSSEAQFVQDSNGRYHAIWQDVIDGFAYSSGDGTDWTAPVVLEAPFFTRRFLVDPLPQQPTPLFNPKLVAGEANAVIHAFWIDDSPAGDSTLYHSQVPAGQFTQFDAWSARTALDTGVVAHDAVADADGRVHVAYLRADQTIDRPAGVYYVQQGPGGSWSASTPRYFSRYLRLADDETANVQVATGNDQVYIAWDDPSREQVFVARSPNGGLAWDPPQEIDRRLTTDAPGSEGPGMTRIGVGPAGPVIVWRAGHSPGEQCAQYSRYSSDGGASWSFPERLSESLPGCLSTAEIIAGDMPLLLGTTRTNDLDQRAYLLAWDGTRWSEPQLQPELAGFTNAETNQHVALQCLQGLTGGDVLSVIGCDVGAGGDIWWLRRPLTDTSGWFISSSVWQGPERIALADAEPGEMRLVADELGAVHLYWFETGGNTIAYSRREGEAWSPVIPVITAREGSISAFSVATGNGRIYLVWRDNTGLYFSQASTRQPTEWSAPLALIPADSAGTAPMILFTGDELLVTYAVQLNEQRGVYLVRSSDEGVTWSPPSVIFDGAAAGWEMVDRPELARSTDGALHAQYSRRSYPPEFAPLDLGYSRSVDNGLTWSPYPASAAVPALWSGLNATADGELHRLWTEAADDRMALWHVVSGDGGRTWSERQQIAILPAGPDPVATTGLVDLTGPAGRLQLLGMDGGRLLNWFWDAGRWHQSEPLSTGLSSGSLMSAAVNSRSQLLAALSVSDAGAGATLYGMSRMLEGIDAAEAAATLPPATVAPAATATPPPVPTDTPEPTPTISLEVAPPSSGILSRVPFANSRFGQLGLGIVPAALVVVVVVIVALRAVRMGRKS